MSRKEPTPIETNKHGDEVHPSWGKVILSKPTGHRMLFDSSIQHQHYVTLKIAQASRRRDLHRDWIHSELRPLIEIAMTQSQWAQLVSSFGDGTGTSVTIDYLNGQDVPSAVDESRLEVMAHEVSKVANEALANMKASLMALRKGFDDKAGRREMAVLIADAERVVGQTPGNMKFAADSLTEYAENVVTKSKVDIDAMAIDAAEAAQARVDYRNARAQAEVEAEDAGQLYIGSVPVPTVLEIEPNE